MKNWGFLGFLEIWVRPSAFDVRPNRVRPSAFDVRPNRVRPSAFDVRPNRVHPSAFDVRPNRVRPSAFDVRPSSVRPRAFGARPNSVRSVVIFSVMFSLIHLTHKNSIVKRVRVRTKHTGKPGGDLWGQSMVPMSCRDVTDGIRAVFILREPKIWEEGDEKLGFSGFSGNLVRFCRILQNARSFQMAQPISVGDDVPLEQALEVEEDPAPSA
ncbi:hypothetical protein LR48_Vigan10g230000 [Vigna angularis]|uniref:Uncharacterized protein n=1 Tax=Phaseolus angularis TaxID=3914 RepID=A0A0L9VN67_PHAAN|nr:hypothetical protein LR48_Vigan10g230000 [Vigna angularis]